VKVAGKAACFTKRSAFLCAALVVLCFLFGRLWWLYEARRALMLSSMRYLAPSMYSSCSVLSSYTVLRCKNSFVVIVVSCAGVWQIIRIYML
jgi:hypothetical protein